MKINKDNKCNRDTSVKASSFFCISFYFSILCLFSTYKKCTRYDLTSNQLLQSKSIDISDGLHLIESLKALVITRRQKVDEFHNKWYKEALTLTEKINITDIMPRVVGTHIHRSNIPAGSVSDYYKRTITIPLLDHLMHELDYTFDSSKPEQFLMAL